MSDVGGGTTAGTIPRRDCIVLVTGADGQVGWEVCRAFASLGEVVPLRRADVDLADGAAVRDVVRDVGPSIIVNAAAYTDVDGAERDRATAFAVNADAPRVLAIEAARLGATLIHYSTDYVFDGTGRTPYSETDPAAPLGGYGESKLAGDRAVLAAGGPHLILRTSWVYATRGQNFLLTMLRLAHEREELRVVADQTGTPTSARLVAATSARLIAPFAVDGGFALPEDRWGLYNLTARGATSWHEFATRILALDPRRADQRCRRVVPITTAEYPTLTTRPAYSVLDPGRLERTFGVRMPEWGRELEDIMRTLDAG